MTMQEEEEKSPGGEENPGDEEKIPGGEEERIQGDEAEEKKPGEERAAWGSKLEFLLSCLRWVHIKGKQSNRQVHTKNNIKRNKKTKQRGT